jgi:hypothetical protein
MNAAAMRRTSTVCSVLLMSLLTMNVAMSDPISAANAFVSHDDMIKWLADGERGVWIQTENLKWFYARFRAVCRGLSSTNSVVFDTRGSSRIDRTSSVLVPGGERCRVQTFAPSSGPSKDRYSGVVLQPQSQ